MCIWYFNKHKMHIIKKIHLTPPPHSRDQDSRSRVVDMTQWEWGMNLEKRTGSLHIGFFLQNSVW